MVISLSIPWDFQLQEEYTRWEAVSPDEAEKIPMFHADFPGFTRKIVEHSRYLLKRHNGNMRTSSQETGQQLLPACDERAAAARVRPALCSVASSSSLCMKPKGEEVACCGGRDQVQAPRSGPPWKMQELVRNARASRKELLTTHQQLILLRN